MQLPDSLRPVLDVLRRAYPDGLPDSDYLPLLAFLREEMSERNLAAVVAEFIDGETVVVANDSAAAASIRRPSAVDVQRVRHRLEAGGWEYDELSPPRTGHDGE
jgi:hypothetical protein